MKKRVVSILASIALFASAFFVFPAVSPVLAGGAGSPLTQEHPQAIHVWYERDPGLNEGTAYATYKMAIKPYTYAEGDKLVFDVYTDSDYDPQGTPSAKEEAPLRASAGDGMEFLWGRPLCELAAGIGRQRFPDLEAYRGGGHGPLPD